MINLMGHPVFYHFRSYEIAKISGDDVANKKQNLAYFHTAIFEKSSDLKVLASCVTFASQDRVPPGSVYNVSTKYQTFGIFY